MSTPAISIRHSARWPGTRAPARSSSTFRSCLAEMPFPYGA